MNFEISQNFPFLKFIDFKIITNSFIYSLVEQSLETHFHKNNYRGKGYTFGKSLPNFSDLYTLLTGVRGILYEQQTSTKFIIQVKTQYEFYSIEIITLLYLLKSLQMQNYESHLNFNLSQMKL